MYETCDIHNYYLLYIAKKRHGHYVLGEKVHEGASYNRGSPEKNMNF